jgi:hypothetical protein
MLTMVTLPDSLVAGARAVDNHKRRRPSSTAFALLSSALRAGQTASPCLVPVAASPFCAAPCDAQVRLFDATVW